MHLCHGSETYVLSYTCTDQRADECGRATECYQHASRIAEKALMAVLSEIHPGSSIAELCRIGDLTIRNLSPPSSPNHGKYTLTCVRSDEKADIAATQGSVTRRRWALTKQCATTRRTTHQRWYQSAIW